MLVSLNWLKNYVDIGEISPEQLAEKVTKSGIEVESVEYVAEKSENVVVGYVKSCEKHPNADKLNLCQVDTGEEILQIICGAPNVAQGQKVAVAKPGAVLPGNFKIKKVKLRGVESNGMICSLQELGIEEKYVPKDAADGIFVFPDEVTVGDSVEPLLNLNDAVLEFELTPNRADCLSMLGVAYEVAALLDQDLQLPSGETEAADENAADYIQVEVEAKDQNPYYGAFVIKGIEVKDSPLWMKNHLIAAGIRPINNVVDITNFVMLEYGQPLHAFDYDRLQSEKIVVRHAREGETLVTLDDQERVLTKDHLVITDGEKPVALAGVMGGLDTEVHNETNTVLLEAAYFASSAVRKAVKDTGLRSESSTRFEKGIDPNRVREAGQRACQLLAQYANGTVLTDVVEFDEHDRTEKQISLVTSEVNKRLGTSITDEDVADIFRKLRFKFERNEDKFTVYAPTRRGDITIFEDLLEEIARIYGYDNLPFTLPEGEAHAGALTETQQLKRDVKGYLQSAGLMETITYSLTNSIKIEQLISPEIQAIDPKPVALSMPMSEDHKYLRLSLLPELLSTISYNQARNQADLFYFELGKIFVSKEETVTSQPSEQLRVSGALSGNWVEHPWQQEKKAVDFYLVKGIMEGLFDFLKLPVVFKKASIPQMHPGRTAVMSINGKEIGFLGQLHPALQKQSGLKDTYVFDVNMEEVILQHSAVPSYSQIPKYPSVTRDIAFILDKQIPAGDVKQTIEQLGAPLVKQVNIFDLYQGANIGEDKKSVAYSLVYQHPEKTLTDEEVEESYTNILNGVNEKYGAFVRS